MKLYRPTADAAVRATPVALRARKHEPVTLWDRSPRSYAVAFYDDATKAVCPLSDEESAVLPNSDLTIRREWFKWNAMTDNRDSLVVVDAERVQAVLRAASKEQEGDVEVTGLE